MIKTYGVEKLPLAISLAIKLEQNSKKDFSKLPLLKEHERKLNQIIKTPAIKHNAAPHHENKKIKDLFEKPLKITR